MKDKEYILSTIRKYKKELANFGVTDVGLFGSYANGEFNSTSDIDLLIDFDPSKEMSPGSSGANSMCPIINNYDSHETYDNFISVCELLESVFDGEKVEVVTKGGLSPHIGSYILKDAVYV